jgi:hypothetical protein
VYCNHCAKDMSNNFKFCPVCGSPLFAPKSKNKTGKVAIGIGVFFLIIAGLGFVYPISTDGHSIIEVDEFCKSGLGQLGQLFSASGQQTCQQVKLMSYGVYGFGLIGIILIISGSVASRGP